MNSLELCAGAGGQALGLERAGFEHRMLVEIDPHACATLRHNRPHWQVQEGDLAAFDARSLKGIDLVAGGVPCPPFSKAGKQLGADDERDLFPQAIRVVNETRPQAVMLENVRGLLDAVFVDYRNKIARQLQALGYWTDWHLFNAADFGVCQLRFRLLRHQNLLALDFGHNGVLRHDHRSDCKIFHKLFRQGQGDPGTVQPDQHRSWCRRISHWHACQ